MKNLIYKKYKRIRINHYTFSLIAFITITVITLIFLEIKKNKNVIHDIATTQALSHFYKDQAFRHWGSSHGGVYVVVDSLTPPNPYLIHVNERDIKTPSGKSLTLMNPAYMVRQLNESFSELYGIGGHITSLNPLRPENKPDDWEVNALKQFESGVLEVSEFVEKNGNKFFRLMRPMITAKSCLKCHGHQGYTVGDIRGGVSITIPEAALIKSEKASLIKQIIPLTILWFIGVVFILYSNRRIRFRIIERDKAESLLVEKHMDLQATEEELRSSNEELRVNTEELQETNKKLKKAKKQAEENDRLKSAFLANMSHEIRTPMNAILGFSGFLCDNDISDDEKQMYIRLIQSSSQQLLQLINDIIDISKIETNQLEVNKDSFGINKFMEEIGTVTRVLLQTNNKTNIDFHIHKENPSEETNITTDINRLKQILLNLIMNAIKFTEKGEIEIGYQFNNNRVQFFVKDTGIGVAKEKQGVIFNRFVQLEDYMTREFGGTGIGLAICKGLISLLDGNIWLISDKGQGCTFYIDIPHQKEKFIKASKIEEKTNLLNYNFRGKTVLIVEDDENNFLFIRKLLENKNIKVLHAINGEQAVELCRLYKKIDLVLMDIQLPVLNGLEATKIIRSFDTNIPIIAQTAYAMLDDKQKCLNTGCNDYIAKPIGMEELYSKMNNFLN